jgi:hypothetical protein
LLAQAGIQRPAETFPQQMRAGHAANRADPATPLDTRLRGCDE